MANLNGMRMSHLPLQLPHSAMMMLNKVPDTILMLLDMDLGTLSFMIDDRSVHHFFVSLSNITNEYAPLFRSMISTYFRYLGIAFSGLRGKTLFPIVSSVWGHCEVGDNFSRQFLFWPVSQSSYDDTIFQVTMRHLGSTTGDPPSLSACCRRTIR